MRLPLWRGRLVPARPLLVRFATRCISALRSLQFRPVVHRSRLGLVLVVMAVLAACGGGGGISLGGPQPTVTTVAAAVGGGPAATGTTSSAGGAGTAASGGNANPAGDAKTPAGVDACSLLADAEINAALKADAPQYRDLTFEIKRTPAQSPVLNGVACEYQWSNPDSAEGTFIVEIDPGDYFALVSRQPGAQPVPDVHQNAVRAQGDDWALVHGFTAGVVNMGDDVSASLLLKDVVDNVH